MLSGSHTARVWYAGPTKQRFALLGTLGETDVFHDGTDLWQWDSDIADRGAHDAADLVRRQGADAGATVRR